MLNITCSKRVNSFKNKSAPICSLCSCLQMCATLEMLSWTCIHWVALNDLSWGNCTHTGTGMGILSYLISLFNQYVMDLYSKDGICQAFFQFSCEVLTRAVVVESLVISELHSSESNEGEDHHLTTVSCVGFSNDYFKQRSVYNITLIPSVPVSLSSSHSLHCVSKKGPDIIGCNFKKDWRIFTIFCTNNPDSWPSTWGKQNKRNMHWNEQQTLTNWRLDRIKFWSQRSELMKYIVYLLTAVLPAIKHVTGDTLVFQQ